MKIGELARATGTKVETVRYYERIGVLPEPLRTEGNYRDYGQEHLERLSFVRHCRGLGFDIAGIRSLLDLADDPGRDCGEVDVIASGHLVSVEYKIAKLQQLESELRRMISACRGGKVESCNIMRSLAHYKLCDAEHC